MEVAGIQKMAVRVNWLCLVRGPLGINTHAAITRGLGIVSSGNPKEK